MTTPSEAAYWQDLYDTGQAGWDLQQAAPAWEQLCALHEVAPGRTLVLGAGPGHDARWFARRGHDVTAVDFAASAVQATRAAAEREHLSIEVLQRDLFELRPEEIGLFDLVVEHTCFCAIEPRRRAEYVDVVTRLVRGGGLLVGVFYWIVPPGGPPFGTSAEEVERLFSPTFEVLRLEVNPASIPRREGKEGWAVMRRR